MFMAALLVIVKNWKTAKKQVNELADFALSMQGDKKEQSSNTCYNTGWISKEYCVKGVEFLFKKRINTVWFYLNKILKNRH